MKPLAAALWGLAAATLPGPIATTLDNKREPFVPVDPTVPGKNH